MRSYSKGKLRVYVSQISIQRNATDIKIKQMLHFYIQNRT